MTSLRIRVRKEGSRYVATAEVPDGRTVFIHRFDSTPTGLLRSGSSLLLESRDPEIGDEVKPDQNDQRTSTKVQVARYGRRLFHSLFGNGEDLDTYLKAQDGEEPVDLEISIGSGATSLSRLPWEYLHNGRYFLALDDRIRLSRTPDSLGMLTPRSTSRPLRILVIIPFPKDQPVLDYEEELTSLHKALSAPLEGGALQLHVLSEATQRALYDELQRGDYQVLHYLGHSTYDLKQRQGFLRFEGETGLTEWIMGQEFTDLIKGSGLQLLVLQAYQDAPIGMIDAFNDVAAKALRREIPEVLTVPVGLPKISSRTLQRVLYTDLGKGASTVAAVDKSRRALQELDRAQDPKDWRFDWGVPMLYRRAHPYPLVRQDVEAAVTTHGQARDVTPPMTNRSEEIRAMRGAQQKGVRIFYIWGKAGIGKSRLVKNLLQRPGVRIQEHLTIQCAELEDPFFAFNQIATFWQAHASERHARAAHLLLDSSKDPFERALLAQSQLANARYALFFEDIDAWFETPKPGDVEDSAPRIVHDLILNLLLGLLSAESRTSYYFTGQQRWADLNALPVEKRREIHLPLLEQHHAIQLMATLPGLSAAPYETKEALYWHVGGHPEALILASGWVRAGHDLEALIDDPPLTNRDSQAWIGFFTHALIRHLDPGERRVLEAAAVLNRPFTAQQISELTSVDSHYATPLIDQWSKLGMVERTSDTEPEHYRFHTLIRDAVLNRLNPDDLRVLHRQAASYYGGPFLDAARRQALIRSGTVWSNARVSWLARDNNGILGLWLRRESDPQARKRTITRALRWHHHLLVARALPEAAQIAQTLAPVLDQEGQRDLSRLLLQQSLVNHNAVGQAEYLDEHLDTLAKLRLQDGHLQSALDVYEEVIASLSTSKNQVQRAYLRIRAGKIQQQMGDFVKAIDHYQRALKLMRSEDNVEGEAQALHSLAKAYRESGDSRQALVYSQCAMECYQELGHMQGVALIHYEQGLNLKALSRNEAALERFTASLKLARQLSDRVGIASALTQIGETFEALGQEQLAIKSLKEAANHYARLQSPREQDVLSRLESIYAQQARFEQAVNQFREAKNGNL